MSDTVWNLVFCLFIGLMLAAFYGLGKQSARAEGTIENMNKDALLIQAIHELEMCDNEAHKEVIELIESELE